MATFAAYTDAGIEKLSRVASPNKALIRCLSCPKNVCFILTYTVAQAFSFLKPEDS
jgi:hypothetical protein